MDFGKRGFFRYLGSFRRFGQSSFYRVDLDVLEVLVKEFPDKVFLLFTEMTSMTYGSLFHSRFPFIVKQFDTF